VAVADTPTRFDGEALRRPSVTSAAHVRPLPFPAYDTDNDHDPDHNHNNDDHGPREREESSAPRPVREEDEGTEGAARWSEGSARAPASSGGNAMTSTGHSTSNSNSNSKSNGSSSGGRVYRVVVDDQGQPALVPVDEGHPAHATSAASSSAFASRGDRATPWTTSPPTRDAASQTQRRAAAGPADDGDGDDDGDSDGRNNDGEEEEDHGGSYVPAWRRGPPRAAGRLPPPPPRGRLSFTRNHSYTALYAKYRSSTASPLDSGRLGPPVQATSPYYRKRMDRRFHQFLLRVLGEE